MDKLPDPEPYIVTIERQVWRCGAPDCQLAHTSLRTASSCLMRLRRTDRLTHALRDLKILERHEAGETQAALAFEYEISPTRVQQICNRQRWKREHGRLPNLDLEALPPRYQNALAHEIPGCAPRTLTPAIVAEYLTPERIPEIYNIGKLGVFHILAWMQRAGLWLDYRLLREHGVTTLASTSDQ